MSVFIVVTGRKILCLLKYLRGGDKAWNLFVVAEDFLCKSPLQWFTALFQKKCKAGMGINYNLQSQAKSSAGVTQMFAGTYEGDLGLVVRVQICATSSFCSGLRDMPSCSLGNTAWCYLRWGALSGIGHCLRHSLRCLHGKAQGITWQTLFGSHLPIRITEWSFLLYFFLLVQENYAADGVIMNFGRDEAKK